MNFVNINRGVQVSKKGRGERSGEGDSRVDRQSPQMLCKQYAPVMNGRSIAVTPAKGTAICSTPAPFHLPLSLSVSRHFC